MATPQEHIDVMKAWRIIAYQHNLSNQEIVTLAANMAGLAIADAVLTEEGGLFMLEVAQQAMNTAWTSKIKVRNGEAVARQRPC